MEKDIDLSLLTESLLTDDARRLLVRRERKRCARIVRARGYSLPTRLWRQHDMLEELAKEIESDDPPNAEEMALPPHMRSR
jgi:hypothetical protein